MNKAQPNARLSRRDALLGGGALAAGLVMPDSRRDRRAAAHPFEPPRYRPADFAFVHLTDMHVTPRRDGDAGYAACVEHVKSRHPANTAGAPKPSFAVMGGDLAFDGLYNPKDKFANQVRLYREISDRLGMPYFHCMGNHDVLGWNARRKVEVNDPDLGKKMIRDALEWPRTYYSFDVDRKGRVIAQGGRGSGPPDNAWHIAVLDSIYPVTEDHGPGYKPAIGEEQREWLAHDLGAAGDRPKVVVTHHAVFCNIGQQQGNFEALAMNRHMVLHDGPQLRDILERHNVKLVLQGHSHRPEEYRWRGVWYVTSPAVSGSWWSGDWVGSAPGYTLLRCTGEDIDWQFVDYDWQEHLEPEDTVERQKLADLADHRAEQARLRALERGEATP